MPRRRPLRSWSVFERRRVTIRPARENSRSATSSETSSERLKAQATPTRSSARSRRPTRVPGSLSSVLFKAVTRAGALPSWAVPMVRRIPACARRTRLDDVGESGVSEELEALQVTEIRSQGDELVIYAQTRFRVRAVLPDNPVAEERGWTVTYDVRLRLERSTTMSSATRSAQLRHTRLAARGS
jgi:hypothetical protein